MPVAYQGQFQGLQSGIVQGVGTGYGTGSGPALLADFDFRTPVTATNFSSQYATDEWLLQETSGTYANNVGSETLTNSGGLQGQTAVGLFNGTDFTTRKAWESNLNTTTDALISSGTTAGDVVNVDFCVRIVFRMVDFPTTANPYFFSKYSGGTGWALYRSSTEWRFFVSDGVISQVVKSSTNMNDGSWHYLTAWYDESAEMIYMKSDQWGEVSASTSTSTGSFSTAGALQVGNSAHSAKCADGVQFAYAGVCVGASAQAMYNEDFWTHASDPTGLATTQTRTGLMSLPLNSAQSVVGHYGVNQLALGWSADIGGLAFYSGSTVTNLLADSEDFTAWTNSNSTDTALQADAPDGFRTATDLTASAANGNVTLACTVSASTDYTFQVWVKRNGGSDVAGEIRMMDTFAVTETVQAFTATDTWQRVSVTHTVGGTTPAGQALIQVDTNTESILVWGAQVLEGTWGIDAPYIRTDGGTAALSVPSLSATVSGGDLIKGAKGEIEIISASARAASGGATAYLLDVTGTGDNDRRALALASSGTTPTAYVWNSAGTSVATPNEGVQNTDGEAGTHVMRWSAGAALSGNSVDINYNSSGATGAGAGFTSADSVTEIQIGNTATPTASNAPDAYIQRIRIWDGFR